ncbi:MAG: DotU family type IV/VI secretion system protein [Acidobacteriota bacterium]|nr:DotU family type IV/VI secretion system protein [Acidobacteriota bacterium]
MNGESYLLTNFRDFYREVVRLKRVVGHDPNLFHAAAPAGAEISAGAVWQELLDLLERQAVAVRRGGGEYAAESYRDAQYVMAALADETFIHLDWPGREAWRGNLLESRLFQSHRAGEEVFLRIDRLLRTREPIETELAKVYLLALGLGFQGRYRGPIGVAHIAAYKRQLYAFVANVDPDAPRGLRPLLPEAYGSTLEVGEGRRLPHLRPWVTAAVAVLALWLVVSHGLWLRLISDLEPLVRQILERN